MENNIMAKSEDYRDRMVKEHDELKERLNKLHVRNIKNEAECRASCECRPYNTVAEQKAALMREQEEIMTRYLRVLEIRMTIEGIVID